MATPASSIAALSTGFPPESPSGAVLPESLAARRLGIAPRTLQDLRLRGEGPPYVQITARRIGYLPADLDAWLRQRVVRSTAEVARAKGRSK
jgi:predicted DNA-binding transcriptional regulator AlpA